ncbi:MAG: hypothetical protein HY422_03475 [Candidatus Komeilibacteria bacterium]|nr:hypothetical protein [Candidatus Komeilibacteria bacterium]
MLENSRDILNYTLAAAAVFLTFFICWILWYVVGMFRDMRKVMRDVTKTIEKFNTVLDFAKEKISSVSAVFPLIIKATEKIAETIGAFREKRQARRSKDESSQK